MINSRSDLLNLLKKNALEISSDHSLFNPKFHALSVSSSGLFLDFSKNKVNKEVFDLLLALANKCNISFAKNYFFSGEKINVSEQLPALHHLLRNFKSEVFFVDGVDVCSLIRSVNKKIIELTERIHSGLWKGFTGKNITDVVNIGIGGSDIGSRMVYTALRKFWKKPLSLHFISNVDGHEIETVLKKINPETSLFVISSKSFATKETLLNAQTAKEWFLNSGAVTADIAKHFVAVTTNTAEAIKFGIAEDNIYPIWDWVGGRYSVWSAIGLPVMLAIGADHFMEFLAGAHAMDVHFRYAPLDRNMPVLLALIGIWNRNFLGYNSLAVAPYHEDLSVFSRWLQQLEMESNGKNVQKNGEPVTYGTAPIVFGNTGVNGQHSYFQLFHQGTDICPVDFIAVLKPSHPFDEHHKLVLADCFAQSEALILGCPAEQVRQSMVEQGIPEEKIEYLVKQKRFDGNRPSNMIIMNELRPETLGALMALYEHKVFVQGIIWNINSFDQMGVELGKNLANNIYQELCDDQVSFPHDSSTAGLIELARAAF